MKKGCEVMSKLKPPKWGAEVHRILFELKMSKTQFAKLLGVNYTEMCNVILGYRNNPKMQAKIVTVKQNSLPFGK